MPGRTAVYSDHLTRSRLLDRCPLFTAIYTHTHLGRGKQRQIALDAMAERRVAGSNPRGGIWPFFTSNLAIMIVLYTMCPF